MNSTVLKEIMAFLFGRKYYANIVATKGTTKQEICSYIFATKEAANRHRLEIETTLSFRFVGHYKIFCVNGNTGFRNESRIFYFIHLQNEEDYDRKESSSA